MSRLLTVGLVAGVAVLALAALVDAVVGDGARPPVPAGTTTVATGAGRELLEAAGVSGRLLYTDAADCTLKALALPELEPEAAPDWDTCGFAAGPGATVAPEGTVFDRRGRLRAEVLGGGVDLVDATARRGARIENARAPAFHPDGTLSVAQRGALVSLPPCPGPGPAIARIGRCRSTILTERRLTALARLAVDPSPLRLAVTAVAWLDDKRLVVLAQAGAADALLGVDTEGEAPRVDVWLEDDRLSDLLVSPRRRFVSVVTATGELGIFDYDGVLLGLRGSQVRAAAWSPDERWLALLDGDGLVLVDAADGATVGPVPLTARDLAWG